MRVICAWCERTMACDDGAKPHDGLSHGICLRCFPDVAGEPIHDLHTLAADQLDELPFGALRLAENGTILAYNRFEGELAGRTPERVIGRNFFTEVAPCTNVRALAGWLADARAQGRSDATQLQFVFAFASGRVLMDLKLSYDAERRTAHLLARPSRREGVAG